MKKVIAGTVVSDRMDKTIVVEIRRFVRHPVYSRVVRRRTKVTAHDGKNAAHIGDRVRVVECRPLSKSKRWRLLEVVERAEGK